MLCALGGSVSTAARRGPDAPGTAGSWAKCVCSADMGAAAGLQSAERTWALGSRGICYLGIAAIAWGTVTWVEVGAWTYHYSDRGDYTWEQARNYCQTFFTDLVAIQNKQEIEYLNESLPFHGRYYWIGIRKLGGTWTWVGTRKALTKEAENWAAGEPNNRRSNQDCVEIYIKRQQESGKWNDESCNRKKKALCYQASCQPFPCSQRGECVETIGSYRCECYPGFHGPECEDVVQCAKLEPKGAHMNCSHPYGDFSYNSTCVFECQEGFERQGAGTLQCLASQQWSAEIPTCTVIECPQLAAHERGQVDCSHPHGTSAFSSTCAFSCQEKFEPTGVRRLQRIAAITCPALNAPDRGKLKCSHLHGDFAFGSTCAFSCQTGFALVGSESRQCTATGTWTEDAPRCEAITCPVLSAPDWGKLNCSHLHGDFTFGSTCAFSCQTGFALMGSESRECTATGTWTGDPSRCEAIACPVLNAPDQGQLNCSHLHGDFAFGSTCAFSCQTGFALMGSESRKCTATGTWTGDAPRCAAIACPVLIAPDRGELNCSHLHGDFAFGSTCAFSCQMGFALMGSESRKCTATGTWTGDASRCEAIACPMLIAPDRGELNCSHLHGDFSFGSTCAFSCQTGFALMGSESRECTDTGTWTGDASRCEAIACPMLIAPDRGELNCSHLHGDFAFGSTCAFSCQTGFALMGSESRECTATGTWTGEDPRCEAIACPMLIAPDRGELNCSHLHGDFSFGSTCAFSCQTGFALMGSESRECTATGTWTGDASRCEAIACPVLIAPDRGELNCSHLHGDFSFGSTCAFSCQTGFALTGSESRECTATGTWTGDASRCEAIACPVLIAPDRGELNCSHLHGDFSFGSTCAFSCQTGFALTGSESRECTATGTWTGDASRCEAIACPMLSAPDRGELNCSHLHGDFSFGSTCAFSCQTGFALMGSESRKCTATGTWTGDAPRCAAIKCSALASPKMGQAACSHLHGDFSFGSTCAFSCQTGFVLMGPKSRKCMASGTWSGDTPQCRATSCPALGPPSRGQLSCSHMHGNFTYNSTCTFSCEEGFVRMGAEMLRCTATGNWTRHPPVCAEDGAPFLKQVLAYSSGTALVVGGIVLSGALIALLAKRLSDREEKKKLLNPTSDLGSPGIFTNAAYDANL